jgi:hypothetical protein
MHYSILIKYNKNIKLNKYKNSTKINIKIKQMINLHYCPFYFMLEKYHFH